MTLPIECPWPVDVFTESNASYPAGVSDVRKQAISAKMMRHGWHSCEGAVEAALLRSRFEMVVCADCGEACVVGFGCEERCSECEGGWV